MEIKTFILSCNYCVIALLNSLCFALFAEPKVHVSGPAHGCYDDDIAAITHFGTPEKPGEPFLTHEISYGPWETLPGGEIKYYREWGYEWIDLETGFFFMSERYTTRTAIVTFADW